MTNETTLTQLLAAGLLTELQGWKTPLSTDEQAEMIEREAFLLTCQPDELADAADFIALTLS